MTDLTPSDLQAAAIKAVVEWFRTRKDQQRVFRIFGYAGTGKTTITRLAIAELGLPPEKVLYGAFTGKAALVMTRKGTPASTIHSMIYRVVEASETSIKKLKEEVETLRGRIRSLDSAERTLAEAQVRSMELRLRDMHKPGFVLNDQSPVREAELIVLDEVSMVGDDMAADLMSFGKPILVLGDPGQLPPIKGEGAFTQATPDVMLTEIHRQAADSAIVRLATLARQSRPIPHGQHDEFVWKMRRADVSPAQLLKGGQVICGFNATRFRLNNAMKNAAGYEAPFPGKGGEKIICLKNRHDIGLINGQFLELSEVGDIEDFAFMAKIKTEDGVDVGERPIYRGWFDDHVQYDKEREQRDYWRRKGMIECVWGYAITAHKSQGSSWKNVIVWDDGFGRTAVDRARWLYTSITRAESGLVILE